MKTEEYGETRRSGNIEEKIFVIFDSISKTKWKKKENPWPLTTNGSTNHANLLVIVAPHVSLASTSPWFKSVSKYDPEDNSSHPNSINKCKLHLNHQN